MESRPKLVGRKVVSKLVGAGIPCTYVYMNAISFVMKEVNTVFMGASAILMNGTVVARVGSAAVGMVAHACNVPVVICAETCKFHEQVIEPPHQWPDHVLHNQHIGWKGALMLVKLLVYLVGAYFLKY